MAGAVDRRPLLVIPEDYFEPLSKDVISRIRGKSFQDLGPISLKDLCYLRIDHVNFAGEWSEGEIIVHKNIAAKVQSIFTQLFEQGYPIQSMRLIDDFDADDHRSMAANNTSAFCMRPITGGVRWSEHSYGTAIDLNPLYNPYVKGATVLPPEGAEWADRTKRHRATITDAVVKIFTDQGFEWGGDFEGRKDYHHFEYPRENLDQTD